MVASCILCGSASHRDTNTSFHRFPKIQRNYELWLQACNLEAEDVKTYSKLCSKHFTSEDFHVNQGGIRTLRINAVPTIFKNRELETNDNERIKKEYIEEIVIEEEVVTNTPKSIDLSKENNTNILDLQEKLNEQLLCVTLPFIPFNKVVLLKPKGNAKPITPIATLQEQSTQPELRHSTQLELTGEVKVESEKEQDSNPSIPLENDESKNTQECKKLFPRYFGDIELSHVDNSRTYERVKNIQRKQKLRIKVLQQKNRRLRKRILALQGAEKRLQEELEELF